MDGLLPEHECTVEFEAAEVRISKRGYGFISTSLHLIDGPYAGRKMFYAYRPSPGYSRDVAEYRGLPTNEDELGKIAGLRLHAKIRRRPIGGVVYNCVEPRGRPL